VSKEALKEEIKFLTEIFRLLAILTLAVGGGTVGLILGAHTALKNIFAAAGFIAYGCAWSVAIPFSVSHSPSDYADQGGLMMPPGDIFAAVIGIATIAVLVGTFAAIVWNVTRG